MNSVQSQKIRFNMNGFLIEFDERNFKWTWTKWEYTYSTTGVKRVVRRKGGLEFMQMFRSLVGDESGTKALSQIRTQQEMTSVLKKNGIDYIFLYQGEICEENEFKTVSEAEIFYQLNYCTSWNLTDYWFAYDCSMESWGMFDVYTGKLAFTPDEVENRLKQNNDSKPYRHKSMLNKPAMTFH